MRFLLFIILCSGCGFLDDEILLDEQAYVENELQYLELDEMSLRGGGYSSYTSGHYYYGGAQNYPLGRRVRIASRLAEKKSSKNKSEQRLAKTKGATEGRTTFIGVVNNYGAKAHHLEENL